MKLCELVEFLNQDRTHMKQGLILNKRHGMYSDIQQMYLLESVLAFDEISLRALLGSNLKASEFLKLEQTCLADVIAEEGGNKHLRIEDASNEEVIAVDKDVRIGYVNFSKINFQNIFYMQLKEETKKVAAMSEKPPEQGPVESMKDREIKPEPEEDLDLDELLRRERIREKEEKTGAPGITPVRRKIVSNLYLKLLGC